MNPRCPFLSVVMPVRNEAAHLRSTLLQVLEQDYADGQFEVLVADGRSTDATREIVRELQVDWSNLRLLDNPRQLSSAGRNRAVQASRGEVIVVIDGHCNLGGRRHLQELADAFRRSGADSVGRPQPLDLEKPMLLQEAIAAARASILGHQPASFIYAGKEAFVPPQSVAVAYRRAVFHQVGLFDEAFDACEDVEFNHRVDRAGLTCFFTPRVEVRYAPRETLAGLFGQLARYGRGRVRLWRKHPETFSWPCFLPALFLTGVVAGPLFALLSTWLALVYGGVLALYTLGVLGVSAAVSINRRRPTLLPLLPLVFAVIHAGAGWGVLWELLAGTRRQASPALQLVDQDQSLARAA